MTLDSKIHPSERRKLVLFRAAGLITCAISGFLIAHMFGAFDFIFYNKYQPIQISETGCLPENSDRVPFGRMLKVYLYDDYSMIVRYRFVRYEEVGETWDGDVSHTVEFFDSITVSEETPKCRHATINISHKPHNIDESHPILGFVM